MRISILYIIGTLFILFFNPVFLQSQSAAQVSFGKNRVQYHHQFDDWSLYETGNFITYWYGDARNVAQSALQLAEYDFPDVQQLLEHQPTEKIEMLVFSDLTDLKQSNIGEDDVFLLQTGETKVVGNKVFIYFDGDHRHLRAQIREGVAGVLLNSMLYGANLQEIVSNAVLLNLPPWYTRGLTAFCGEDWNTELDDQLRELIQSGRFKSFDRFAREQPRFAGQAFWYYINLHFGKGTISNLLYLTRINRSVDNGFFYVLGNGYRRTTESMMDYFKDRYTKELQALSPADESGKIEVKNRKKLPLIQLKISPDGKRLAYVSNDLGKWKVYTYDLETGVRKRVMKGGARNALQSADYNYPQIAWNPDNQQLAVLYERRDVPHLAMIELATGKKEVSDLSPEFQRVFSMDFISPAEIALSAAVKGYSDLFIYRTITRQTERLSNDFWDDLDATVVTLDGHKSLIFSSNRLTDTLTTQRLDTILPVDHFDLFLYDLETRNPVLQRLTDTPLADERMGMGIDSSHFSFLSDESGIINRKIGKLEPYVAWSQTRIYMKDGAEFNALDMSRPIHFPLSQILIHLAPLDTVLSNIDSTLIDSIKTFPVIKKRPIVWNSTNYDRNIIQQHSTQRAQKMVEAIYKNRKTIFHVRQLNPESKIQPYTTHWREQTLRANGMPVPENMTPIEETGGLEPEIIVPVIPRDTIPEIEPGWLFQVPDYIKPAPKPAKVVVEFSEPTPESPKKPEISAIKPDSMPVTPGRKGRTERLAVKKNNPVERFYPYKIIPYRLRFRTDYISTTMDNNQMFEGLQLYEGPESRLNVPPPGVLLRANFKDLLENYVIEAGFRLPITFNGMEYYLWLDDKKKRMDKRFVIYRRTFLNSILRPQPYPPNLAPEYQERTTTLLGQYELRYPLDVFTSLRATFGLREDKVRALSSDPYTLEKPDRAEQRASVRLAAVFDNTVDIDINFKTGTRAKAYTDIIKGFDLNTQPNLSLKFAKGFTTVIGVDARHYQMLDRRSQIAFRFAGATSFGSEKMLYILGGVDNWILPRFNDAIGLPAQDEFAYQAPAVNLRGFKQNIRNGNSYALLNTELRIPIFKYFSKKPVMGNFFRNFQIIGFFDMGTAWQGPSPYDGDNPINIVFLEKGPDGQAPIVTMRVNYFRDPVVAGYGVGLRTLLFGMYLRADYAWGIESREIQKPLLHIALGTDF
ncbi:MAG: BamA/TamA family outer membrane protein [Lewinellaceae bacterium]|nr:BamA/TamA family outer membrane protein [Saprospiraceae bacterium]MCB9344875.1 BamA/TamA family outer membrane protein [Lewinellaceae bacterium]